MNEDTGLFPFDDAEVFTLTDDETEDYVVRDFEIDWDTMKLTGKIVEGVDAIVMWVHNALRTKRYEWLIYSWDFGEEYTNLLSYSYTLDYLNSEVDRLISECLEEHPYISGIENLEVEVIGGDKLHIAFTLVTDFGEEEVELDV